MKKIILLLLFLAMITVGCSKDPSLDPLPEPQTPEPEPSEICRYCGQEIPIDSSLERPFLVIYGNTKPARPPSNVKQACYVYEIPVEGGITRLLAVFAHNFQGLIGPVRSARTYHAVLTREHNGILAHCGFSPSGQKALSDLRAAHINEISYGQYYQRDKSRKAPHNLYTDIEHLIKGAERFNYLPSDPQEPPFKIGKAILGPGENAEMVDIAFSNATKVNYLYTHATGLYMRSINGGKHEDNDGVQLSAKNLIVQFVRVASEEAGSERLTISLIGEGSGWYFTAGKAYPLTWSKKNVSSPTEYTVNGQKLVLTAGSTWLHLVSTRAANNVTYE